MIKAEFSLTMKIKEFFAEKKYDNILYYLKENGVVYFNELLDFDINKLLFVPGVTEEALNDVIIFIKNIKNVNNDVINISDYSNTNCYSVQSDKQQNTGKILLYKDERKESNLSRKSKVSIKAHEDDLLINEIFSCISHGELLIRHCNTIGIKYVNQLKDFSFDSREVKGIGHSSMQKLHNEYINFLNSDYVQQTREELSIIIPDINKNIPIRLMQHFGIEEDIVKEFLDKGITSIDDICNNRLTNRQYRAIIKLRYILVVPINKQFENKLNEQKDMPKSCLMKRIQGLTLQAIADDTNITRERVRQIINKACNNLLIYAEIIGAIICSKRDVFNSIQLKLILTNNILVQICEYILRKSPKFLYVECSGKFVTKTLCIEDFDISLSNFIENVIGEGLNFYDNLELIEDELTQYGIDFLDFEDIMNYLVQLGYVFYGDYVAKKKVSYGIVCIDAIANYFNFDIKLDSDLNNTDMLKLRGIIDKHYHGLILPDNNRALTAGITRHTNTIILSGRGRYCPIKKVIYNMALLDEVYNYIEASSQTSFLYNELFSMFQGRFLAETNINNANFLHGILMYCYSDVYTYERDMLVKNGAVRQNVDQRISKLISSNGKPMTKREIKKIIPGLNDFVISFSIARVPELIQWEYNTYNHVDNLDYNMEDLKIIEKFIDEQMKVSNGYISEVLLFELLNNKYSMFIKKNNIKTSLNLYYFIGYLFATKYKFKRPHIVNRDFPVKDITVVKIANIFLKDKNTINYIDYMKLAKTLRWADGTKYGIFAEIERNYVRISMDDYVINEEFNIEESRRIKIKNCLTELLCIEGYYAINNIMDYERFPQLCYKWNGFLLESIISQYDMDFILIIPQAMDRRYLRSIVVEKNKQINKFEDLVIYLLKKEDINIISETELLNLLKIKGLITNTIPRELYDSKKLLFKNENFLVR